MNLREAQAVEGANRVQEMIGKIERGEIASSSQAQTGTGTTAEPIHSSISKHGHYAAEAEELINEVKTQNYEDSHTQTIIAKLQKLEDNHADLKSQMAVHAETVEILRTS